MTRPVDGHRPLPEAQPIAKARALDAPKPAATVPEFRAPERDPQHYRRGAGVYRLARALRTLIGRKHPADEVRRTDALRRAWVDLTAGGDINKHFGGAAGADTWIDEPRATEVTRPSLASTFQVTRAELEPVLDQRRRVLTAMFNGVCMDVHHRLESVLDNVSAAGRMRGWRYLKPVVAPSVEMHRAYASPRPNEHIQPLLDAGVMQHRPELLVATSAWMGTVPGATAVTLAIPIGDYGRPLADAVMFAAQVMSGAARKSKLKPTGYLWGIVRKLTFQGSASRQNPYRATAIEGVVSIAQAVGQLTAQRVPGKDLDTVLDDTLRPLLQLAVSAPFGTLAPITNHGWTARGPMTYDVHGRAGLPEDLLTIINAHRAGRYHPVKGEMLDDTRITGGANETFRGCPVAFGSPTIGKSGYLTDGNAGLHVLTADFIALVKLHLRATAQTR